MKKNLKKISLCMLLASSPTTLLVASTPPVATKSSPVKALPVTRAPKNAPGSTALAAAWLGSDAASSAGNTLVSGLKASGAAVSNAAKAVYNTPGNAVAFVQGTSAQGPTQFMTNARQNIRNSAAAARALKTTSDAAGKNIATFATIKTLPVRMLDTTLSALQNIPGTAAGKLDGAKKVTMDALNAAGATISKLPAATKNAINSIITNAPNISGSVANMGQSVWTQVNKVLQSTTERRPINVSRNIPENERNNLNNVADDMIDELSKKSEYKDRFNDLDPNSKKISRNEIPRKLVENTGRQPFIKNNTTTSNLLGTDDDFSSNLGDDFVDVSM